jgi:hypothetical protein
VRVSNGRDGLCNACSRANTLGSQDADYFCDFSSGVGGREGDTVYQETLTGGTVGNVRGLRFIFGIFPRDQNVCERSCRAHLQYWKVTTWPPISCAAPTPPSAASATAAVTAEAEEELP